MLSPLVRPCSTPCGFPLIFSPVYPFRRNDFPAATLMAIFSWGIYACENPQGHLKIFSKKSSSWYYSSLIHSQLMVSNSCPSKFQNFFVQCLFLLKHEYYMNISVFQVHYNIEFTQSTSSLTTQNGNQAGLTLTTNPIISWTHISYPSFQ